MSKYVKGRRDPSLTLLTWAISFGLNLDHTTAVIHEDVGVKLNAPRFGILWRHITRNRQVLSRELDVVTVRLTSDLPEFTLNIAR